jgi:hypothetical protein
LGWMGYWGLKAGGGGEGRARRHAGVGWVWELKVWVGRECTIRVRAAAPLTRPEARRQSAPQVPGCRLAGLPSAVGPTPICPSTHAG